MAFTPLITNYQDDVLNTSVNQVRKYVIVNNADGSISLTDVTTYLQTGTFIGAQDLNLICGNMNTIMGYIETSSGDLAAEFQTYFNEQKTLFQYKVNTENADFMEEFQTLLTNFQTTSSAQFTTWFDASTALWSQEVTNRLNLIIQSLNELVNDNGPFVLNKAYRVANIVTVDRGNGVKDGYIAINPVPSGQGILPTNTTYFAPVTLQGDSGIGLTWRGNWLVGEIYQASDLVNDDNALWVSNAPNQGSKPSESNSKWTLFLKLTNDTNILTDQVTLVKLIPTIVDGKLYLKETNSTVGTSLSAIKDERTGYVYSLITIDGKLYERRVS